MCGIAGYISRTGKDYTEPLQQAVKALQKRGPDNQSIQHVSATTALAHARLSIIDTSSFAHQPMSDKSGRYTIVFNGEIFNYRELRKDHLSDVQFHTTSDTEVLLNLFIKLKEKCLPLLNGFFAFAVYDKQTDELFIARDRYGIKPLLFCSQPDFFAFASELKALFCFPFKREIDYTTLALYLQLNYVPGNYSMVKGVQKLAPGCYLRINKGECGTVQTYYQIPYNGEKPVYTNETYEQAKQQLKMLIEAAVERRLVSDVPLGAFLSGGIDSSIITACAAKKITGLNTYSIGFKDEPFFDETHYANLVAEKYRTNHTVFSITNHEMLSHITAILDYIDEPFADSSAIAVYILCKETRKKATVALSGDGGDELFGGYNKHQAEMRARQLSLQNLLLKNGSLLFDFLPQSRHGRWGNLFRQLSRYSKGLKLPAGNRYWEWCKLQSKTDALALIKPSVNYTELASREELFIRYVRNGGDLNDILYADAQLVLPGDMLTKVDLMSMANSLEVRVPLLDYTVVNYAFSLPFRYKTELGNGKKILKDAFRSDLPQELFTRNKKGFEVPLRKWLTTDLKDMVSNELLGKEFILEQQIFNWPAVEKMKQKLHSSHPGDSHANVWALVVFQYWYKKYLIA